ncbi:hypothetical protein DERP_009054 [Dermatophagoides pteronyssinus]|uniref:Uncharacterized protein n=1 Tax=Dermatophagoides pteronyssinus TaxID=6956 RepID=A0ABQ8JGW3_DERPT|nr:hypothetical protein DERP_009054 [Dermatophagoides pteronyssinus]
MPDIDQNYLFPFLSNHIYVENIAKNFPYYPMEYHCCYLVNDTGDMAISIPIDIDKHYYLNENMIDLIVVSVQYRLNLDETIATMDHLLVVPVMANNNRKRKPEFWLTEF